MPDMSDTEPLKALAGIDHLKAAKALKDLALEVIASHADLGGPRVAGALKEIMDVVWDGRTQNERHKKFKEVCQSLDPQQTKSLLEGYARMGHLYEIAGLAARDNFLKDQRQKNEQGWAPGDPGEFIHKNTESQPLDAVINKLNEPVFEVVMTQHPTNTNSLQSIQAQREIGKAIAAGDTEAVRKAVAHYMDPKEAPLLPRSGRFTVRDETEMVLNALNNVYDDLPKVYEQFDRPLEEKFGKGAYDPMALKLNIRFSSWGSAGDKDGNNSITAENTLEGIILHKRDILKKYADSLNDGLLGKLGKKQQGGLLTLRETFKHDAELLDTLLPAFEAAREDAERKAEAMRIQKEKESDPEKKRD